MQRSAREYIVEATFCAQPSACTKCGVVGELYRHGTKVTAFRDAPVHGKQVTVQANRQRYRCRACEKTFLQDVPDMDEQRRMTVRCLEYIGEQALIRPFTHVADDIGVHEKTIRNIAGERIERLMAAHTLRAPRILGMDEVSVLRKPRAVFTDIGRRAPIDLLESRSKPVVAHWLHHLPDRQRVEVVAMDMWAPYRDAVRAVLPDVLIVVDKFHVLRMASQALEVVRKATGHTLEPKGRRQLVRSRFSLLRRPTQLSAKAALDLDAWLVNEPTLRHAYQAKEAFYSIWDLKTKDAAREEYDRWLAEMPTDIQKPFKPVVTAMKNWNTEIFGYWDHRITNAYTEAVNGVLKLANRMGRGYSFNVIRARVLFGRQDSETMEECQSCHRYFEAKGQTRFLHNDGRAIGPIVLCGECRRLHTDQWFTRHAISTRQSE